MSSYKWVFGALLSIAGSVCSNLGVNTQKWSFNINEKKPKQQQKSYCCQPGWVFGLVLVIFGSLGDFAALGLAAQSIVAPIGAVTLVANIVFAHFWLKEDLNKKDLIGTVCIILGSTLAVAFGDHEEVTYTLEQLIDFYKEDGFIVYAVSVAVSVGSMYVILKKIEPIRNKLGEKVQLYDEARERKDKPEYQRLETEIDQISGEYKKYEKIHPFLYCATSGVCGGQNILFGKCVAEMIATTLRDPVNNNQMNKPLTWTFVACMLVSIFTQLHFLALALTLFDALYCVPVFQCFFITVSTLGGAAYFQEFKTFNTNQWIFFPIGIVLTLSGVYLLSARKMGMQDIDRTTMVSLNEGGRKNSLRGSEGDMGEDLYDPNKPLVHVLDTENIDLTCIANAESPHPLSRGDGADGEPGGSFVSDETAAEVFSTPTRPRSSSAANTTGIHPDLQDRSDSSPENYRGRANTDGGVPQSLAGVSYNPRVSLQARFRHASRIGGNMGRISSIAQHPNSRVNKASIFALGGVV